MTSLKVAGASLNQTPLAWQNNTSNILKSIEIARKNEVDILCLPELAITGYGCEDMFLADWIYEKSWTELMKIIPQTKGLLMAVGLPFLYNSRRYNCCAFIANGQLLGLNPKQHLAIDGVHYEFRWFKPGTAGHLEKILRDGISFSFGDVIYMHKNQKIGVEICEDMWQGENRPICQLSNRGVDIVLNPSASHFALDKSTEREKIILEGSKRFPCTYIYANLLGNEAGRMIYDGEIIIAQNGKLLAKNELLSFKEINLISTTINDKTSPKSAHAIPLPEPITREEQFTRAIALGLFDYMRKSRTKGFVLSLSGGADSSSTAILVAEMVRRGVTELGVETFKKKLNLSVDSDQISEILNSIFITAYQGTQNSSYKTYESAQKLAKNIGAKFFHWKIDEQVEGYTKTMEGAINSTLNWNNDDITLQNIQARSRSPIIWMLANKFGYLLLTTSNRSEADVGYSTMDGDTSGSLAPIAAIDKFFILNWLKWAEKNLPYPALKWVNQLTPTAELRPGSYQQSDEDDLMPYNWLLKIEKTAIEEKLPPQAIFDRFKSEIDNPEMLKMYIKRFFRLWSINQWKRERTAPAFHLDTFNVDPRTWCRFPILSSGFIEELEELG